MRTASVCLVGCAIVWFTGCHDSVGPPPPPPPPPTGAFVSDPRPPLAAVAPSAAQRAVGTAATAVAYVSLAPGTAPGGRLATIRNTRTGETVSVGVGAGGFDPVPVPAVAGDSLDIAVDLDDGDTRHFVQRVPLKHSPSVVRTYPSSGKRDVPLNTTIVLVFSEPIDSATLTATAVQVRRGATAVPGRLAFLDVEHVTVLFTPAASLAPSTVYSLVVTQDIRDLEGDPLESGFTAEFTTAATAAGYEEYFVDSYLPLTANQVGDSVSVHHTVLVIDGAGAGIEQALVRFSGSIGRVDPDTARAGLGGVVSVHWTFKGTLGGGAGTVELSACASNSTTRCDMYWSVLVVGLHSQ